MNFTAYLVKVNQSPAINLGMAGISLFFIAVFLFAFNTWETFALILAGGGILLAFISALTGINKPLVEVDNKLLVFDDHGIRIGENMYPYGEIRELELHFDSFYSQSSSGLFYEHSGQIEYGMGNRIRFIYAGDQISAIFYIANQVQAASFFLLTAELKNNKIAFDITYRMADG
jgi:hypothetical protein